MVVRSKVRCTSTTEHVVTFVPVYEPEAKRDESIRFVKAVPWGVIRMHVDNPAARKQFEVDREYYVDFTPAS